MRLTFHQVCVYFGAYGLWNKGNQVIYKNTLGYFLVVLAGELCVVWPFTLFCFSELVSKCKVLCCASLHILCKLRVKLLCILAPKLAWFSFTFFAGWLHIIINCFVFCLLLFVSIDLEALEVVWMDWHRILMRIYNGIDVEKKMWIWIKWRGISIVASIKRHVVKVEKEVSNTGARTIDMEKSLTQIGEM